MKCATLADAPAVLNTNDKAMWVLGFNAAFEKLVAMPGLQTLQNVIECLRADARYVDEEGEATNRLQDLLAAHGVLVCQACAGDAPGGKCQTPRCVGGPIVQEAPDVR